MSTPLPPHLDPRPRHRGRSSRAHSAQPIWRTVGAITSILLLVVAGYYWYTFRGINNGVTRLNVHVGSQIGTSDRDGKDQNILLVGNDDRSNLTKSEIRNLHVGGGTGSRSTDTMMIVHLPANGSKATLISLPRDSYVAIPGHGLGRLNSAYVSGYAAATQGSSDSVRRVAGANLLIDTIRDLTGLTINHYIQVSLLGFYEISNAIGGVPINLCNDVNDSIAANQAAGLSGGSGFTMSKGKHVIKGITALAFVRQRHFLPRGDLDRVRRQQYFLTSAFRQVASFGILLKLKALGTALERNVYLDPSLDLIDLAHQMERLTANNITGKTIPTSAQSVNGLDVLAVDKAKVRAFIDKVIASTNASASASTTAPKSSSSTKSPIATPTRKAIDSKCIN